MKLGKVVLVALMVVLAVGVMAAARNQYGVSDKNSINFDNPVWVGNTLLPKGEYQVLHTMEGTEHVMVFRQITDKTPAEAKVKCALKPLKTKAADTRKGYIVNAKNELTLHELTFQGDTATHVF